MMFLLKTALIGFVVICFAALVFFNFYNLAAWIEFNNPFQGQWAAVQLSDGEVLYGHLSGVNGATIGLRDVYLLDKFTASPDGSEVSTSTDLSLGTTLGQDQEPKYVPVSDAPLLFLNRSAVLYFKFLQSDDPALPYLH